MAYHRLVFRRHRKERPVGVANLLALAGLATWPWPFHRRSPWS
ncbi:MAG: hypothetical protein ACLP9C_06350 [Acidimicrobiales bacterium]